MAALICSCAGKSFLRNQKKFANKFVNFNAVSNSTIRSVDLFPNILLLYNFRPFPVANRQPTCACRVRPKFIFYKRYFLPERCCVCKCFHKHHCMSCLCRYHFNRTTSREFSSYFNNGTRGKFLKPLVFTCLVGFD